MTRILLMLAAFTGLAAASNLTPNAYSDHDDDDGGRFRVYQSDDDDGGVYRRRPFGPTYRTTPILPWRRFQGQAHVYEDRHDNHHHHAPHIITPPPVPESYPNISGPMLPLPGGHDYHGDTFVPPPQPEIIVSPPVTQSEVIVSPPVPAPVRPGEFVTGPVPLYPRVQVEDAEDIHPRAVPAIVAVRSPHGRGQVFVQVFVPPVRPDEVDIDDDGRSVKLEYDDYSVEIESDDGRIKVDYND